MEFQLVSVRSGKDAERILKAYKNIEKFGYKKKGGELFVTISTLEDLMDLLKSTLKQNCFICHDENVIHIYDEKLK